MTDYPRFEHVKGEPDVAHQAYYGGPLVTLVFRLVDRWRARPNKAQAAAALAPASGGIEIHERPPAVARVEFLPGAVEAATPVQMVHRLAPDEIYSRDFLIGSAATMKLQRGLLVAFVAVLVVLVAQGLRLPDGTASQAARNSAPAIKELPAGKRNGSARPGHLEQVLPAHFVP
jgi:hypothetical protein